MFKSFYITGFLAFVFILSSLCFTSCTEEKIIQLEEQIASLEEEYVPMEFEITKYSDSVINLNTAFYNLHHKPIAKERFSLNGNELNFDFQVIQLGPKSFVFFPVGIYSDLIPLKDSIKLFPCYTVDNFPYIYDGITDYKDSKGKSLSKASIENIMSKLSTYNKLMGSGNFNFGTSSHGVVVHDIKNVSQFKKGFVYKVVCHPHSGAVEIVRK